jgi:PKD domain
VIGAFAMHATVTEAVNVRGETQGQHEQRRWTLVPRKCEGSVCASLSLRRVRSNGITETLRLRRTGPGTYAGHSSFDVALRCNGHVYAHGAIAPYRITLTVSRARAVESIEFARRITATYANTRRIDRTPCPLAPSHDAARYTGSALARLPTPPTASFAAEVDEATVSARLASTSSLGVGAAPIVSYLWDFGDVASGAADSSTEAAPIHVFSAPGTYVVTLTVMDANGLTATASAEVVV